MNKQNSRFLRPGVWGTETQFTEVRVKVQVQLPSDLLIDYFSFCKAIAQAICPAGEQELKGIDCIVGKWVTGSTPISVPEVGNWVTCSILTDDPKSYENKWPAVAPMQYMLLSDDGRAIDQLSEDLLEDESSSEPGLPFGNELRKQMVELRLPYKLTDDERELMERLLLDLPALRYPMSQDEVENFMSAYFRLPNRPAWEPNLVTAMTVERRQMAQDIVVRDHQKALQDELTRGRISAVNANYVPVVRFGMGTYLTRDQAIAYLGSCGILNVEKVEVIHRDVQTEIPEIHEQSLEENTGAVRKPKLTKKERQEIVNLHDELKRKDVDDYSQKVAEQFGITDRYVRKLVENARDEPDVSSITHGWVGTKPKKHR